TPSLAVLPQRSSPLFQALRAFETKHRHAVPFVTLRPTSVEPARMDLSRAVSLSEVWPPAPWPRAAQSDSPNQEAAPETPHDEVRGGGFLQESHHRVGAHDQGTDRHRRVAQA